MQVKLQKNVNFANLTKNLVFLLILILSGCANQLPPGGGEEDKEPPKALSRYPKPNTVNYEGSMVKIGFDKYVDKRSFQDAFRISPSYKGDMDFNWSGTEVEVEFPKPFRSIDPNKTFVINIGTGLKDLHGNALSQPITFAFSTGPRIDSASVSGKVYNNDGKNISIFAYRLISDTSYEPSKRTSDYITETSPTGEYILTNMASGKYRIIAVYDDDKNLLYTEDRENYGVLPFDIQLQYSTSLQNVNFNLKDIKKAKLPANMPDVSTFFKDSANIVYSSVENNYKNVLPDQSIFLFFNRFKPQREELVNSLKVNDENGRSIRIIFNWLNDSLVEVFPPEKYNFYNKYELSFTLKTVKDSTYKYLLSYNTISPNSYGELTGTVNRRGFDAALTDTTMFPVILMLNSTELKPPVNYTFTIPDTVINLKNILEADYNVFSFIDEKGTGQYDYGSVLPFQYSEPFYIYPHAVSIKGGWAVENLILNFGR